MSEFDPSADAERIDGHSLEELSDYLDRGREPRNPAIESSPSAQHALSALSRLRDVAPRILRNDEKFFAPENESWITRILDQIGIQAHAGRDIPIAHDQAGAVLSITEGAVRGLVREVGDDIDGLIVERCRLRGEIDDPDAAITVQVEVSTFTSADTAAVVEELRLGVARALALHTELRIAEITVDVHEDDLSGERDE